jgi:hypothetical protein
MEQPTNPYASPTKRHPPIEPATPPEAPPGSLAGVVWGLRLVLFGLVAMIVAEIILASHRLWINGISAREIYWRLRLLFLGGELLALAGIGVCALTTRDARAAKPVRIAAAAAATVVAREILWHASFFVPWLRIHALWSQAAEFAIFVLISIMHIAFLLYLKRLAWSVHRRELIVASQRLVGFAIAMVCFQFWQSGYFDWTGHAWLGRDAGATTEQIAEILWPVLLALAAGLVQGLRKAVAAKQARYLRLAQRG